MSSKGMGVMGEGAMINVHHKTNNIFFRMGKLSLNIVQTFSKKRLRVP